MSRKHRREQVKQAATVPECVTEVINEPVTADTLENNARPVEEWVPKFRRCPLCWGMHKGVGVQYSCYPIKKTKYFRCKNCAHTWSAVVIAHVQEFNGRVPDDISER